jgi:hypothetical protein
VYVPTAGEGVPNPFGLEIIRVGLPKFAVIFLGPSIIISIGETLPLRSPLQDRNPYIPVPLALNATSVPASYQFSPDGNTDPCSGGFATVINLYCNLQETVTLFGESIRNSPELSSSVK